MQFPKFSCVFRKPRPISKNPEKPVCRKVLAWIYKKNDENRSTSALVNLDLPEHAVFKKTVISQLWRELGRNQ